MTKQNSESVPGKKILKDFEREKEKRNLYTYVYVH